MRLLMAALALALGCVVHAQTFSGTAFTILSSPSVSGSLTSSGGNNFTYAIPNFPGGTVTYVGPGSYSWEEDGGAAKGVIFWHEDLEGWCWLRTYPSVQGPYDFVVT